MLLIAAPVPDRGMARNPFGVPSAIADLTGRIRDGRGIPDDGDLCCCCRAAEGAMIVCGVEGFAVGRGGVEYWCVDPGVDDIDNDGVPTDSARRRVALADRALGFGVGTGGRGVEGGAKSIGGSEGNDGREVWEEKPLWAIWT